MTRLVRYLALGVTGLVILLIAIFAVTNRKLVDLNFWPFAITVVMPTYFLALGGLAIGMITGALLMWVPMVRWRGRARRADTRVAQAEARLREARMAGPLAPPAADAAGVVVGSELVR